MLYMYVKLDLKTLKKYKIKSKIVIHFEELEKTVPVCNDVIGERSDVFNLRVPIAHLAMRRNDNLTNIDLVFLVFAISFGYRNRSFQGHIVTFRFRESGISSIVRCLRFTANWVWPASRCAGDEPRPRVFPPSLAGSDTSSVTPAPPASPSPAPSSSDDGGFLPRLRAPLHPAAAPPLFRASSPASAWPPWPSWPPWAPWPPWQPRAGASSPWTPWSPLHASDLSSVPFPSSGDGSFPTPPAPAPSPLRRSGVPRPRVRAPSRHAHTHEASPESRSSSSGFGSKNASSSQHNRSSRAGSLAEWRPPPYRAPPPPPPPPPATIAVAADAGSVDVHYEWDRASRTPTPSTPERPRARPRDDRDVEARVRAMKEEFLQFRKRQALRRRSPEPPLSPLSPLSALASLSTLAPGPAESVC